MVFAVIEAASGLSPLERRRAGRTGPVAVLTRSSYPSLLASAGFVDIDIDDRTAEYRATQQRWIEVSEHHETALRRAIGDDAYDERLTSRRSTLRAIDDQVLVRRIYSATRPTTRTGVST
jgi:hypothetical protein